MKYFEDEVNNGNWDEVEKYLSGFTKVDDNRYSMKIFFEIRKQKYLEALDKWVSLDSKSFPKFCALVFWYSVVIFYISIWICEFVIGVIGSRLLKSL